MKTQSTKQIGCTARHNKKLATCAVFILLLPLAGWAGGTVTNCTEADFLAATAGGGTVTFACDGTITLTRTFTNNVDLVLDGTGHNVTISGGRTNRIFQVNPLVRFTAMNLAIANGRGAPGGGAIYNDGGTVNLVGDVLTENVAAGMGSCYGGAIYIASGRVDAINCTFTNNGAAGNQFPPLPYDGFGGAIFNSGTLNITGCSFVQNWAIGGSAALGPPPTTQYQGFPGYPGGSGLGGAIYSQGPLTLRDSLFASNSVAGGFGGEGGSAISLQQCRPAYGGNGGRGGDGCGAGVYAIGTAPVAVVNCTFAQNRAVSGVGGAGGQGEGTFCFGTNYPGGNGGTGATGEVMAGVYHSGGTCAFTNCTVAFNQGGGLRGVGLVNSLVCSNPPGNSIDHPLDLGHNLSSDSSCGFTAPGSMNNTDARLAALANNGGPTWTMALLPGSPAIDAGNTAAAPSTDQRGYLRPAGAAADIGAFEFGAIPPPVILPPSITKPPLTQTAEVGTTVHFCVGVTNTPPESTRYQWYFSGTHALSGATNSHLYLTNVQNLQAGSYTVVVTNLGAAAASPPAMLSVIAPVPRRMVPALTLTGQLGSFLSLDYRAAPGSSAIWKTLDTVLLTNASQWYFDAIPYAPHRFYRAWQTNVLSPPSIEDVHLVPAITLTGAIGTSVKIDYINQFGPIDAWVTNLATVALTNTSQLYFDTSVIGQPARLYRLVPVP